MKLLLSLLVFLLGYMVIGSLADTCEEETFFGITKYKTCPGPLDSYDQQYCCGQKENRRCCSTPFGLDEDDFEKLAESLPTIIGIIVGGIIFLIVLCVVCCCCCPFCLLHKRRTRGVVHNPTPAAQMQTVVSTTPAQPPYAPLQSGYPQQMPPAGYPAQPQQAMYPPPQAAAPYPPHNQGENPPAYAEKQMAFNPSY